MILMTIEAYKDFCKAVENIKRKQVENEFQGKGNSTKKKKGDDKQSPLLDFDFDGKMKEFMDKSKNNDMFKPLVQSVNQVSNVDNMISNLKNNVVNDVTNNIVDNITNTISDNISDTISDMNNNNNNNNNNNSDKPVIPDRDIESN